MQFATTDSTGSKIGKYTKYQREKRKWSLKQLAEATGMTPSFLFRLEQGTYQTVKFEVLEKIANAFEMPLEILLIKCHLIDSQLLNPLPQYEYYLKEKYQLPPQAIEDMALFLKFIQKKYHKVILEMKKAHQEYWNHPKH